MILGIAAELSAPPSSPSCFRDVSLYAKIHRSYDIIALSRAEEIDSYAVWFRRMGLFDYIDDIVTREEVYRSLAVEIAGGERGSRLTAHNLHQVLALL